MRTLKYLAIPAVLALAAIAFAATKFPSVVLSRATLASYTSTVAASLSTAEVIELGHFGFYLYSPSSNASADGNSVIEPSDSPATGRWLLVPVGLSGNVAFTVCPSGCTWPTLAAAATALNSFNVAYGANITLNVSGHINETSTPTFTTRAGSAVSIVGAATTNYSVTGISSCSGSAGAYSCVLTLSTTPSVQVGDFAYITGASGGTRPTMIDGGFPVTAVNAGGDTVTVTIPNRFTSAPSGSVTATLTDIPTVDSVSGIDGIDVWNLSAVQAQDIVLYNTGSGTTSGWSVQDNGRLYVQAGHVIGAYGFGASDVLVTEAGEINGGAVFGSGGGTAINASKGSVLDVTACYGNGATGDNVLVGSNSTAYCAAGNSDGAGTYGITAQGQSVFLGAVNVADSISSNLAVSDPSYYGGTGTSTNGGATDFFASYFPNGVTVYAHGGQMFYVNALTASGSAVIVDVTGTASGDDFAILGNGDVGIKNLTPAYPLDVNGEIHTNANMVAGTSATIGTSITFASALGELYENGSSNVELQAFSGAAIDLHAGGIQINETAGVTSTTCTQWTDGLCTHS